MKQAVTNLIHRAHDHDQEHGFWEGYFGLLTDPAHLAFEVTFSIFFDIIVVGLIVQKLIIPKLRKDIHKEIDQEHGITHENGKTRGDKP